MRTVMKLPVCAALFAASLAALLSPFVAASALAAESAGEAASEPFPRPRELEADVRFWVRVYAEVTTDQGLLHDDRNLGLVYEVLRFDPADSPAQRERKVTLAKARYAQLLRRFAAGATGAAPSTAGAAAPATAAATADLTRHERRILQAFGSSATPAQFLDAISHLRFQLGQADRFHEGLLRAEAYESTIKRVLAERGVPPEIGALPHVESSFNPAAYSRVGAAGLWQFMPGTAKRYMRVDSLVDQRLDPYASTEAAANLMLYNFRLLGTWPLAVTAYNHGPGGLRRAADELQSSDIAVIVKRYQGATFGFASRNFYVSFLAALEVDRNAEKYFGPLLHLPDTQNTLVVLPDYVPIQALAKAFKADMGALRVLNPALRPPIWSGARLVPRGYALRLPGALQSADVTAALARLAPAQRYTAQRNDGTHKVRRGETLAGIAAASGVSVNRLLAANGWNASHELTRGETVRIPLPASRAEESNVDAGANVAATSTVPATAPASPAGQPTSVTTTRAAPPGSVTNTAAAQPASVTTAAAAQPATTASVSAGAAAAQSARTTAAAPIAAPQPAPLASPTSETIVRQQPPPHEPVSQRQSGSTALLPAAAPTGGEDATDYHVGADDTVVVLPDETLGHYADWSQVPAHRLAALNKLRKNGLVTLGHTVKLDLSQVSAAQFVEARRGYHQRVQDAYFAGHRISGTETYTVKRGDSLRGIAEQRSELPLWLVVQYNPDLISGDLRPGTLLTLPRVETINRE